MGRGEVTTGEGRTNWSHKEPKQNSFPMPLSPAEREHTARVPVGRSDGGGSASCGLTWGRAEGGSVHGAGVSSLYGVLLAPPRTPEP